MRREDMEIVNIDQRTCGKCRKASKTNGDPHRRLGVERQKNDGGWMLPQTIDQVRSNLWCQRLAVAHCVLRIGVDQVQRRLLMIRPAQVRFDNLHVLHGKRVRNERSADNYLVRVEERSGAVWRLAA